MTKFSIEELCELTENDGMAEAIRQVSHKKIADPELADLWEQARAILLEIEEFFEDNREFDDIDEDEDEEENERL